MNTARFARFWMIPALVVAAATAVAQPVDCAPHSYPQRTNQSLAVDPYDDRMVNVGIEGEGYFKTTDDGDTWTRIVDGVKAFPKTGGGFCYSEFFATVIDPRNPEHVCFAMAGSPGTSAIMQAANQGVYCSENGGRQWEQRVGPTMNLAIYALAIDPTDSGHPCMPGATPTRRATPEPIRIACSTPSAWSTSRGTAGGAGRSCRRVSSAAPA